MKKFIRSIPVEVWMVLVAASFMLFSISLLIRTSKQEWDVTVTYPDHRVVIYRVRGGTPCSDRRITLPNGSRIHFPDNTTIECRKVPR